MQEPPRLDGTLRIWRPTLYTFVAVFLSILVVGALVAPAILGFAERVYVDLLNDVNERQARAMDAFLQIRLEAGLSEEQAIAEFQAATAGSEVDRGYVCLINQDDGRYLSHPNLEQLGMDVKPGAVFTPDGRRESTVWSQLIQQGAGAMGHLSYGPRMTQEMVYFTPVEGTGWTISTHENLSRVEGEIGRLRQGLLAGSIVLSLLFAIPASAAARGVSRRREAQIERQGELERLLLEEEDARKALELQQGRDLQLSLLPRELPDRAGLRLAARMETASEVGGDFYDVIERDDGSLILAIGDATGHGLKSGMMVVAIKSLLTYGSSDDDLVAVAEKMHSALRRMRLGRLNMAFGLMRLDGPVLEAVGAGMPPALIHRRSSGAVEELALSGAPLGSPMDFPYSISRTELEPGDTLLFMSDGLPELQLAEGGHLGYPGVERLYREAVETGGDSQSIVDRLVDRLEASTDRELEDDVTLLVARLGSADRPASAPDSGRS